MMLTECSKGVLRGMYMKIGWKDFVEWSGLRVVQWTTRRCSAKRERTEGNEYDGREVLSGKGVEEEPIWLRLRK